MNSLLPLILADDDLHAKWLNTFSFLEYIGFRKIVKSQPAADLTHNTLAHAVEEGRHALRLKRIAMKIGGDKFTSYSEDKLLCATEAGAYFQTLDRACADSLGRRADACRLNYLYVTWLVEIRALAIYRPYQGLLISSHPQISLSGLLAEEDRHLAFVENELRATDALFPETSIQLKDIESCLYDKFITALAIRLRSPAGANVI